MRINVQQFFNPADTEHFAWTDDGWYSFDESAAKKAARKKRDAFAKELKADGYTVKKCSLSSQLISRGGIGSGKPHVEFIVTVFGVDWW